MRIRNVRADSKSQIASSEFGRPINCVLCGLRRSITTFFQHFLPLQSSDLLEGITGGDYVYS